jgi:hypothetical protein
MSAHTPGPWSASGQGCAYVLGGNPSFVVADCNADRPHRAEDFANARLIAAAPDLLAALEACVDAMRNGLPGREKACHPGRTLAYKHGRAAIAKARGQA